jgi:tetratricopeptide (TPR) repeat protein
VALAACGDSSDTQGKGDVKDAEYRSDRAAKMKQIEALEAAVKADQSGEDSKVRQQLLVAYADFVNFHHDDENTPEFLFKAAKMAVEVGKPRRAIEYLVNLHDGFPRYERKIEAAFMTAFIYENMLNDRIMAEKYYERVVELYPESNWAEDARVSLQLLYMTDEEKIELFIKKNQVQ